MKFTTRYLKFPFCRRPAEVSTQLIYRFLPRHLFVCLFVFFALPDFFSNYTRPYLGRDDDCSASLEWLDPKNGTPFRSQREWACYKF